MGRLLGVAALLGACACGPLLDGPLPTEELSPYRRCFADSECIVIENGCCCDMVSIQAAQRSAFRALFTCEDACECALGPMAASCRSGACTLVLLAGDPP